MRHCILLVHADITEEELQRIMETCAPELVLDMMSKEIPSGKFNLLFI